MKLKKFCLSQPLSVVLNRLCTVESVLLLSMVLNVPFFFLPPIWPEYILYKKSSPVIQMLAAWNSYVTVLPPFLHVWLMDRVSSKDNTNCILCLFCISSAVILQALFSVSIVWFLWCVIYPTVCVTVSLVSLPCWQWCLFFSLHSCCCGY